MSAQTVETILSRAMSDAQFAEALFTNPDQTLVDFELSAEDFASVKDMVRAAFDEIAAASPEECKSMGWTNRNETALIIC